MNLLFMNIKFCCSLTCCRALISGEFLNIWSDLHLKSKDRKIWQAYYKSFLFHSIKPKFSLLHSITGVFKSAVEYKMKSDVPFVVSKEMCKEKKIGDTPQYFPAVIEEITVKILTFKFSLQDFISPCKKPPSLIPPIVFCDIDFKFSIAHYDGHIAAFAVLFKFETLYIPLGFLTRCSDKYVLFFIHWRLCGYLAQFTFFSQQSYFHLHFVCGMRLGGLDKDGPVDEAPLFSCLDDNVVKISFTTADTVAKCPPHLYPCHDRMSRSTNVIGGNTPWLKNWIYLYGLGYMRSTSRYSRENVYADFFLFQVVKRFRVCVYVPEHNQTKFKLFDGPNVLCKTLKFHKNDLFMATSFQAILVLKSNDTQAIAGHTRQISFSAFLFRETEILIQDSITTLNFPCVSHTNTHAVFHVLSSEGFSLQINLTKVEFSGFTSHECYLGGVTMLTKSNKTYLSLCDKNYHVAKPLQKLYLGSSELFMIVHQYRGITSVSLDVKIHQHLCVAIQIDLCFLANHCGGRRKMCSEKISDLSTTQVLFHWNQQKEIEYTLNTSGCFIFQVYKRKTMCSTPNKIKMKTLLVNREPSFRASYLQMNIQGYVGPHQSCIFKGFVPNSDFQNCTYCLKDDFFVKHLSAEQIHEDNTGAKPRETSNLRYKPITTFLLKSTSKGLTHNRDCYIQFEYDNLFSTSWLEIRINTAESNTTQLEAVPLKKHLSTHFLKVHQFVSSSHVRFAVYSTRADIAFPVTIGAVNERCGGSHSSSEPDCDFLSTLILISFINRTVETAFLTPQLELQFDTGYGRTFWPFRATFNNSDHVYLHLYSVMETTNQKYVAPKCYSSLLFGSVEAECFNLSRIGADEFSQMDKNVDRFSYLLFITTQLTPWYSKYRTLKFNNYTEAEQVCSQAGSSLPVFFTEKHLRKLYKLFRSLKNFPPLMEAVFIGLHHHKVRSLYVFKVIYQTNEYLMFLKSRCNILQVLKWRDGSPAVVSKYINQLSKPGHDFWHHRTYHKRAYYFGQLFPSRKISPYVIGNKSCTLMLIQNLAQPEWISVNCSQPLTNFVLCQFRRWLESETNDIYHDTGTQMCAPDRIRNMSDCLLILWRSTAMLQDTTTEHCNLVTFSDLRFLTDATKFLTPIFIKLNLKLLTFEFNALSNQYKQLPFLLREGYHILASKAHEVKRGQNMFSCDNTIFISGMLLCDGKQDCLDNTDESYCECEVLMPSSQTCHKTRFFSTEMVQTLRKQQEAERRKIKLIVGQTQTMSNFCDTIKTHSSDNLCHLDVNGSIFFNDFLNDCGNAQDEPLLKNLVLNLTFPGCKCPDKQHISCLPGHSKCYHLSELCNYKLDSHRRIVPCGNGAHIADCKLFDCNMRFKCPENYCIPWEYVCDRKWDCPLGIDEQRKCDNHDCKLMFHCKDSRANLTCVHLGMTCDGFSNCPEGDDEVLCDFQGKPCPTGCTCVMHSIFCHQSVLESSVLPHGFEHFMIVEMPVHYEIFSRIEKLATLILLNTNLSLPCSVIPSTHLVLLRIQNNSLQLVTSTCFGDSPSLGFVDMASNEIETLQSKSFSNLTSLRILNLSYNLLEQFPKDTAQHSESLEILSLIGNNLALLKANAFALLTISVLETSDYRLCCLTASAASCSAKPPWYLSCFDLLPELSLKIVFGTVFVLNILLNFISCVLSQKIKTNKNKSAMMLSTAVNVIEIMTGVYLCVIWATDQFSKGQYVLIRKAWRASGLCLTASSILLLVLLLDPVLLVILALSRLMVVKYPVDTKFKVPSFCGKCIGYSSLVCFFFVFSVTVILFFYVGFLPNSLCSPFFDPTHISVLFSVISFCSSLLHLLALSLIVTCHKLLFNELKKSQETLSQAKSSKSSDTSVYAQIISITVSNFCCWVPMMVIHTICQFATEYPVIMLLWMSVVVTPLNSLLNPLVFIFTSIRTWRRTRIDTK